jgi:hypothetical protein
MAEESNTVPETPFIATVFFHSLTNQETRSMWLNENQISALVDKFNEDEVDTVWKAQDLSEAALIAMGDLASHQDRFATRWCFRGIKAQSGGTRFKFEKATRWCW